MIRNSGILGLRSHLSWIFRYSFRCENEVHALWGDQLTLMSGIQKHKFRRNTVFSPETKPTISSNCMDVGEFIEQFSVVEGVAELRLVFRESAYFIIQCLEGRREPTKSIFGLPLPMVSSLHDVINFVIATLISGIESLWPVREVLEDDFLVWDGEVMNETFAKHFVVNCSQP